MKLNGKENGNPCGSREYIEVYRDSNSTYITTEDQQLGHGIPAKHCEGGKEGS